MEVFFVKNHWSRTTDFSTAARGPQIGGFIGRLRDDWPPICSSASSRYCGGLHRVFIWRFPILWAIFHLCRFGDFFVKNRWSSTTDFATTSRGPQIGCFIGRLGVDWPPICASARCRYCGSLNHVFLWRFPIFLGLFHLCRFGDFFFSKITGRVPLVFLRPPEGP